MTGTSVSHYSILEKLGEGGMGVVYKARDVKLNRFVALKFLPPEFLRNEEAKQRFVQEAQTISALQHNNICTIHEIDETEEGQLFIVMDLYDGQPLDKVIGQGFLEENRLLDVVRQILRGLAAAHGKGITHRDIKPANIFVTSDGTVKILDFGLAKLAGARASLTKEGSTVGTAAYMSPEQIRGDVVDPRSDIFSFGIVFYELITGERPFRGVHDAALAYEIVNADPQPIEGRGKSVPPQLQNIVGKALAKEPAERYQAANEILRDLEEFAGGTSSRGFAGGIRSKLRYSLAARISMGSAMILVASAVIYVFLIRNSTSPDVKSLAILFMKNLGEEPDNAYCYGMTQDLIVDLSNVGKVRVAPLKNVLSVADSNMTVEAIGKALRVQYVMESSFRREGDMVRITANITDASNSTIIWGGRFQARNNDASSMQGEIIQSILTHFEVPLESRVSREITSRRTANPEAYEYYLRAKYIFGKKKSKEDVDIARGMLENAIKLDPDFVAASIQLGDTYEIQNEFDRAQQIYEQSLDVARSSGKRLDEATCLSKIGRIYWYKRKMPEALGFFERSLALYGELEDLNGQVFVLNGIANVYGNQGHSDSALATYNRALEIVRRLRDRAGEALLSGNIGIEHTARGEFAEAIDFLAKSIGISEELEDEAAIGRLAFNLGELYRRVGDTARAMQQLDRALEINRRLGVKFGESICVGTKGFVYSDQQRFAQAVVHFDSAIGMGRQLGAPYLEAAFKTGLGICNARQGEFRLAEVPLASAAAIFTETGEVPMVLWANSWLGLVQMKTGQKERALKTAAKVLQLLSSNPATDEEVQILWNLSQLYSLAGDSSKASESLQAAHRALSTRAAKITDARLRSQYLGNVVENREVNAAWGKQQ